MEENRLKDIREKRIIREIATVLNHPPIGVTCNIKSEINQLEVNIVGPKGTPYEKGVFKIEVTFPDEYPFDPPIAKFVTKIYHPNINAEGKINLNILEGKWIPAISLKLILTIIQQLLNEPTPDITFSPDISDEFKNRRDEFNRKAEEFTLKYAR